MADVHVLSTGTGELVAVVHGDNPRESSHGGKLVKAGIVAGDGQVLTKVTLTAELSKMSPQELHKHFEKHLSQYLSK
jgi:hypothetical protein